MAKTTDRSRTVLIIEDDDAVRNALREALVAEDYQAISVGNLQSARRAIREVDFDVVLLDLLLAGSSGIELLEELSDRASAPPVLVVSALLTAGATAKEYGVPVLAKPFGLDELIAAIEGAIRSQARPRSRRDR